MSISQNRIVWAGAFIFLLVAVFLVQGLQSGLLRGQGGACTSNFDCPGTSNCSGGTCVPIGDCTTNADCPGDTACVDSVYHYYSCDTESGGCVRGNGECSSPDPVGACCNSEGYGCGQNKTEEECLQGNANHMGFWFEGESCMDQVCPFCGDNIVQVEFGEQCDGGAGCFGGCTCAAGNTCAGCECQCQIAMYNCMSNNSGDGSNCQRTLRECYLACNSNPVIDKGENALCENLCHNDGGGAADTLCPDGLTCCGDTGSCIKGEVIDDANCNCIGNDGCVGGVPPDICFTYSCAEDTGGGPSGGSGTGGPGTTGTIGGTGDITGGETGGTGDSGSTGGSTASRSYSAPSSFSFSIPSSSKKSSSAASGITWSAPASSTASFTSIQGSLPPVSSQASSPSSRTSSTSAASTSNASESSNDSTGSNGSITSTSSTSASATNSSSRTSSTSSSRSTSTSQTSSSRTSSTSSLLTGIGGDDGGTDGTDGGDTGNTTGGNTGGSSTSTRSTSRSSTSSLTTLVGGACFGTECELGGDYFCGLFSEVCFQTPDFPCIECKAATSARSTRSSSSFAFSLISYTSTPFISYSSSPSDPNSVIPTDSPSLITDPSNCSLDAPCGTNEFCVANECLSEEEVLLLPPFCGNARRDRGEQCDEGSLNSDRPNALCRPDCTIGRCGDTIRDTPLELCDDGNTDNNDGCSSLCQIERSAPTPTETLPATIIELPLTTIIAGVPSNQQNIPSPPKNSDTGPAALALMAAGAAAGYSYMKRKR